MPAGHHGATLGIVAFTVATVAVAAGTMGRAAADQAGAGRAFGPGHCGPIDASYVRGANATGGQILPIGPTEVGAAAPLIAASFNAETVFWATAPLTSGGQTVTVPVDGVTSRVAFVLSTDGSIADMTVTDPRGTPVTTGTGIEPFSFGCVRGVVVERPAAGEWTVRSVGASAQVQIVAVLNATVLGVEPATLRLSANESRDVTVWADVPADGTLLSSDIVVTAESPTDPAAANSAIIKATLDQVR